MLAKVKLALRISHTSLDSAINDTIAAARAEMIRSGISEDKANSDTDTLITQAIITYCMSVYSNLGDKALERYAESWQYQIDNLRKSSDYAG